MLSIVVSRADSASVHIGDHLREAVEFERRIDDSLTDTAGGGTVYVGEGIELREFEERHLELERPADVFEAPTLIVFASRHAGDTGRLLTAHHTGNAGPAEHGGRPNELARACPNAHARVLEALDDHAPPGYDVGMECTHHGPSEVGAPSLFVEVGSGPEEWADPAAARAVARAILALRGISPDRETEATTPGRIPPAEDAVTHADRRHLVGFGGGHYTPRFERIVRETEWAVGHVLADWGLDAIPDGETLTALVGEALDRSAASHALVDGDHPAVEAAIDAHDCRSVTETWVRETDGVPLDLVRVLETALGDVDSGLRFGDAARDAGLEDRPTVSPTVREQSPDDVGIEALPSDWRARTLPADLLDEAFGIDAQATRDAVATRTLAFQTSEGGTRPTGRVVLAKRATRNDILDDLVGILGDRYDTVARRGDEVVATVEEFSPDLAATLGVPEGPAFGRLADGETVEVDGRAIPPEAVREERTRRFSLSVTEE